MKLLNLRFTLLFLFIPFVAQSQYIMDTLAQAPSIGFPLSITFPPNETHRLFFLEKNNGRVRIIRNDTLLASPFLTVSVTSSGEQGLLGLTFHPSYPDSPFVYIYYTRTGDRANMLVRYRDQNSQGINPETLMVIPRLTSATNHNGGNIHFGPDGKLYVTIGEYAVTANAQDTANSNKRGKIHRLNPNGSIPSDNPYPGNSLYVYGCRNSFDFTFDALNGKMYASENGPSCNDEVNLIVAGGNYGWPVDGNCSYSGNPAYKKPLYNWPTNLPAVTGIAVYRGNAFPGLYGKLLVTSYNHETLYQFTLNNNGDSVISAPTTLLDYGSALDDVEIGPDGYIYVANGSYDGTSHLIRLRPIGSAPSAPLLASPANGAINQPRKPTLVWRNSAGATNYTLQVATDSLFASVVLNDSTITDTSKLIQGLSYDTKYFWRVRAKNALGSSPFSAMNSFTTIIATPQIPVLLSPLNNAVMQPVAPVLQWQQAPRAETYKLQVATDTAFASIVYEFAALTDTSKQMDSLQTNTKYFWRVNASNVGGTSAYSQIWKFKTIGYDTTIQISLQPRWNLLSLPVKVIEGAEEVLFPQAISPAYEYVPKAGYVMEDTLDNGNGFWLKFPDTVTTMSLTGEEIPLDTVDVLSGWNLVGSISDSLSGESIQSVPEGIIESQFYGYANGYVSTPHVVAPGKGYWVKTSANGKLILSHSTRRTKKTR